MVFQELLDKTMYFLRNLVSRKEKYLHKDNNQSVLTPTTIITIMIRPIKRSKTLQFVLTIWMQKI